MNDKIRKYIVPVTLAALAVAMLVLSIVTRSLTGDPARVADRVGARLERRLASLDALAAEAMEPDTTGWMEMGTLPEDMIIYKYRFDTLQSWRNEFIVTNEDIHPRMTFQRISRPEYGFSTPLSGISGDWKMVNLGPKWYMARCLTDGISTKVISGLEVCSSDQYGRISTINPHLGVPSQYSLDPVTGNSGYEVMLGGETVFVLNRASADTTRLFANSYLRWIGLALLVAAMMCYLARRRSLLAWVGTVALLTLSHLLACYWGTQMEDTAMIFSPSLYAGGPVWSSFGKLMLLGGYIFLMLGSVYLLRRSIIEWTRGARWRQILYLGAVAVAFVGMLVYCIMSLRSLMLNSSITLEIQWFRPGVRYTVIALVIYTILMSSLLLLIQLASPVVSDMRGKPVRQFGLEVVALAGLLFASLFFGMSSQLGFHRELSRVQVWANRLAVDRDIALELTLRGVENGIASDEVIGVLAGIEEANSLITSRVRENYLLRATSDYDINVSVCNGNDMDCLILFNRRLAGGTPIAEDSRFVCCYNTNGRTDYAGLFSYISPSGDLIRMLVEVNSKANREDDGYYSIFTELGQPGNVMLPDRYSYAKYIDGKLVSYKGTYAYPTVIDSKYADYADREKPYFADRGWIHFVSRISDYEVIIISRSRRSALATASSGLSILVVVLMIMLPLAYRRKRSPGRRNTFRRKITITLVVALFAALASLAAISIKFVFDRSSRDARNLMTGKITTIQTMIESLSQDAPDFTVLATQDFRNSLLGIAATTKSDITLYTTDGRAFVSTVSEVFDRMLLSQRMNDEAFHEIIFNNQRLHIQKENFSGKKYYAMYAPIFNRNDEMVAIVSSPYSDNNSLMREAVPHAILMFIIALTLLALFTIITSRVISRLFEPLDEIGRKMSAASTSGLEYISYDREDEITALVNTYNRMVADLAESSKILAQTERDKAWSQMARQVAHEIKNPLTPMKLTIQRLIRLKDRGDGRFEERFDEMSGVILEQIDILTETANEFSTFAKLYTEDPVEFDLDKVLEEQISLFDNRENLTLSYIGYKGATICGPKPQLIRVFVNLVSNAIQAVEILQKDAAERGEECPRGRVDVLLRAAGDRYEIDVEDNGAGVSEENIEKLFTPNFTTKSSGTGLGLAISRSIIEKCGGEISYRKSYRLGGACFSVSLPSRA